MTTTQQRRRSAIKGLRILPLTLAMMLGMSSGLVSAQNSNMDEASQSRTQLKMERDEFIRTHQYDTQSENWVLRDNYESPMGMKSRADITRERDTFLRNNRYETATASWKPLKAAPRDLNAMTREEVKAETLAFVGTHTWNAETDEWSDKIATKK